LFFCLFFALRSFSFKSDNSSLQSQHSAESKLDTAEELERQSALQSDEDSSVLQNSASKADPENLKTKKPMPKNETKPTEPDFFGDRYATDDFPSQTVSVSVCLWFWA